MPSTQQKIKKKQEIPIDGASIYIFDRKGSCRIQNMVGMGMLVTSKKWQGCGKGRGFG